MRFNFFVDDPALLDELLKRTRRTKKADVIRDALALYRHLARRVQDKGDKIFLGRTRETATELAVTTLDPLQGSELPSVM